MELTDFQWIEKTGRTEDDDPFHEWAYQHASGRLLAVVSGPQHRGQFMHQVQFLFHDDLTMSGGPFLFIDFDSGKGFAESVVSERVARMGQDGQLDIVRKPDPNLVVMQEYMKVFSTLVPREAGAGAVAIPLPQIAQGV